MSVYTANVLHRLVRTRFMGWHIAALHSATIRAVCTQFEEWIQSTEIQCYSSFHRSYLKLLSAPYVGWGAREMLNSGVVIHLMWDADADAAAAASTFHSLFHSVVVVIVCCCNCEYDFFSSRFLSPLTPHSVHIFCGTYRALNVVLLVEAQRIFRRRRRTTLNVYSRFLLHSIGTLQSEMEIAARKQECDLEVWHVLVCSGLHAFSAMPHRSNHRNSCAIHHLFLFFISVFFARISCCVQMLLCRSSTRCSFCSFSSPPFSVLAVRFRNAISTVNLFIFFRAVRHGDWWRARARATTGQTQKKIDFLNTIHPFDSGLAMICRFLIVQMPLYLCEMCFVAFDRLHFGHWHGLEHRHTRHIVSCHSQHRWHQWMVSNGPDHWVEHIVLFVVRMVRERRWILVPNARS